MLVNRRFGRARSLLAWLLASACVGVGACDAPDPSLRGQSSAQQPSAPVRPRLLVGSAPVASYVREQLRTAPRGVVVYVGAKWCEPCRYFHDAMLAGELDGLLEGRQVIEYDLDVSRAALEAAGYRSRMIPLFALPNADGTASQRSIEGSIKGERAVTDNLTPRLRALFGEPAR